MPRFSRITIIEAIDLLEGSSHAEFDRFLLKFGLEEISPRKVGSITSRLNRLIKYLVDNPDEKGPFGANLTFEIIESLLERTSSYFGFGQSSRPIEERLPKLVNSLKRDGYVITNGKLKRILPENIQLVEKENELNSLLDKFGFTTSRGHLQQAINAHTRGDWASANAQLRSFIESLFDLITDKLVSDKTALPPAGHQRRELLSKLSPPFLLPGLNEWEKDGKGGFLPGLWRRLHPQGSHPGLSNEEDSTFRLHLVILTASHYLRRLDKRV